MRIDVEMHPQGYWVASNPETQTKVWVAYDIIHRQFLYRVNDGPALNLPGSMTNMDARTLAVQLCQSEAKKHRPAPRSTDEVQSDQPSD